MPGQLLFGDPSLSMTILLLLALVGAVAWTAGYVLGPVRRRHDATEATLRARHAQAELFHDIVEHQTEWICHYQPDLTLSFVNEALARQLKMPADQVIGRSLTDIIA